MGWGVRAEKTPLLRILVVDDHPFHRRLAADTLRMMRNVHVDQVESAEAGLGALGYVQPDVVLVAWEMNETDGLAFTQRLRQGDAGDAFRRLPVVMISARGRASEIERARAAGVDEYVQRPFSATVLHRRVRETLGRRREFVESTHYVGPCRRRRARDDYDGPKRRLFDAADKGADSPDTQIRKGLVRMYVQSLGALLEAAPAGDTDAMRDVSLSCAQLSVLAGDMKDRLLMSATSSLFNYVKGVGAGAPLNTDVVQAHLDAVLKLAELPNSQIELRQTVTQQLSVMVTKKLRQAGQAA